MAAPEPQSRPKWQRPFVVLFTVLTLGVAAISVSTNLSRQNAQTLPQKSADGTEPLELDTASGKHLVFVEVMRNDTERAKGLMFRQQMAADRGMLFDFKADSPVTMWMKNTYIPLDMVFILANGVVHRIERNTEPHSEATISSNGPVRAVLELNAGVSDKLGLKPGDRVRHAMFPAK